MIIEVRWRDTVQRMTYDDFERRIRDGEIGPDTEVRFDAVTGDAFRPAGELELFDALADPEAVAFRERLSHRFVPLATAVLVGVQIRLYLWGKAPHAALWLQEHLTSSGPSVLEQGQVWRLLTYSLLHLEFAHILFNLLFVAYTGYHLERTLGRANLLLLFFGSAFLGGLFSLAFGSGLPTLGSSGGGFGMLAASVIFGWKYWDAIPTTARKYFGFAIAPYPILSILTNVNAENVDNWCHLGGLVGGVVLMAALEPEVFAAHRAANRRLQVGTFLAMGLTCALLAAFGPRLLPLSPEDSDGVSFSRPSTWREGEAFTGERGWFSPTGDALLVLATDVSPHPISADAASDALIARVQANATDVALLSRSDAKVVGAEGRWVDLSLRLEDRQQLLLGLVVVRGVYTYRVLLVTAGEATERLGPLADRLFRHLHLTDPKELIDARKAAADNPRSWGPLVILGGALSKVGDVRGALSALSQATTLDPQQPDAWVGRLQLDADYALPEAVEEAKAAMIAVPQEPHVMVAAADALQAVGHGGDGEEILEQGWLALPGDRTLKKARNAWGLSVDLP